MDIKFLSRKFLLSIALALLATAFITMDIITAMQWQWVIMATAVSYVASNAIIKKTESAYADFADINWKDRIKGLFSREFLVCVVTVLVTSMLLIAQRIDSNVWFTVCSGLAVAYNIGNAVGKL